MKMSKAKQSKDDYCPHITMKPVNLITTAGQSAHQERMSSQSGRIRRPPISRANRRPIWPRTLRRYIDLWHIAILERVGFFREKRRDVLFETAARSLRCVKAQKYGTGQSQGRVHDRTHFERAVDRESVAVVGDLCACEGAVCPTRDIRLKGFYSVGVGWGLSRQIHWLCIDQGKGRCPGQMVCSMSPERNTGYGLYTPWQEDQFEPHEVPDKQVQI